MSALRREIRNFMADLRRFLRWPFRHRPPPPPQQEPEGPQTALVIMAHPDDADFLCAGTVARWCDHGWDVYYVLATSGDKGSRDPEITSQELAAIREREQRRAAEVLGVKECIFLGHPDGFLEDTAELRGQIVRLIRRYRPHVVVTWDGYRRAFNHRDHRTIGVATRDAITPAAHNMQYYRELRDEGLEPHRIDELLLVGSDESDYYVDMSAHFDRKMEALRCHASQMREPIDEERAARWRRWHEEVGKPAGYPLAEAFRRINMRRPNP
jgi:LmbE family N-acetylglucosaminyl deacetylase